MSQNEWNNIGDKISHVVSDAVNSGDFQRMNDEIRNLAAAGLDNLSQTLRGRGSSYRTGTNGPVEGNGTFGNTFHNGQRDGYTNYRTGQNRTGNGTGYDDIRREQQMRAQAAAQAAQTMRDARNAALSRSSGRHVDSPYFANTNANQAVGVVMTILGLTGLGSFGIALLVLALVGMVESFSSGILIAGAIVLLFTILSGLLTKGGLGLLRKIRRFKKFIKILNKRTYCDVRELAAETGTTQKDVRKDLESMIERGWFKQGHMDRLKTCLIISDETYNQYLDSERALSERKKAEAQAKRQETIRRKQEEAAAAQAEDGIDPKIREMMASGRAYVEHIERSNEAIPGEEISGKIAYMQEIVEKIFDRVKADPGCADDLKKFMDYYLPTTVKLLDAYEELDAQPVQGENIQASKYEIEQTLDTLNIAFEKLLDSLFVERAWDVSTDISVLKNMLVREGLTEDGLRAQPETAAERTQPEAGMEQMQTKPVLEMPSSTAAYTDGWTDDLSFGGAAIQKEDK